MTRRFGAPFWTALLISFVVCSALAGITGWSIAGLMVRPPLELYRSAVYEMALPKGWTCERHGTENVCRTTRWPKQAIIIAAMKYRGEKDTLEEYESYLNDPRDSKDTEGERVKAERRHVGRRQIGKHIWVDGLLKGQYLPNYVSHNFATVTSHIAVLITLSVHQDVYEQVLPELKQMIETFEIYQTL